MSSSSETTIDLHNISSAEHDGAMKLSAGSNRNLQIQNFEAEMVDTGSLDNQSENIGTSDTISSSLFGFEIGEDSFTLSGSNAYKVQLPSKIPRCERVPFNREQRDYIVQVAAGIKPKLFDYSSDVYSGSRGDGGKRGETGVRGS